MAKVLTAFCFPHTDAVSIFEASTKKRRVGNPVQRFCVRLGQFVGDRFTFAPWWSVGHW